MQKIATLTLVPLSILSSSGINLGDIEIVSSNKTKQNVTQTTSNITLITNEEIKQNGYLSVSEALASAMGVQHAQNGGLGQKSSFFIRGIDSGKVLVLVDGMRLNDPSTTNNMALIEFLPISNVEQIEIIKGGSSSIWGANASGGVINIITKKGKKEGLQGEVSLSGGSYQTKGADISLFYKNDRLQTQLIGSFIDTDGISALAPKKSEKDGYNNKNVTAGIGYDFTNDTKASITLIKTKTKGDFDSQFNENGANDDYSNFITDSTNIAGSITTKIGDIESIFNVAYGKHEREYFYENGRYKYEATSNEYSLINSYVHKFGKSVLGVEYKNIDGFNHYISQFYPSEPTDGSFRNKGIFLSNTIKPIDKLLLEANIRYDDFNKFNNKTTYKLGAKYVATNDVKLGVNYYTSFNAPSVYPIVKSCFWRNTQAKLY